MSTADDIGAAEAEATKAEAQAIGDTIDLSHRGATAVTLSVLVVEQGLSQERLGGALREIGILVVRIPAQTDFAVEDSTARPITEGDLATWRGRKFFVRSADDIEKMSNGYEYKVKFIEKKSLTLGARS